LLKDGKVAVAIEKERLTRTKHDGGSNDDRAIQYCLDAEGITLKDVELVVQNANFHMFGYQARPGHSQRRMVDDARRVVTISHHLAHMFSAAAMAPFEEAAVLVIDGCGNCYSDCLDLDGARIPEIPPTRELGQLYFEKDSYYQYARGRWRALWKDFSPGAPLQGYPLYPSTTMHSIGGAYAGLSRYVFRGLEDPGKLMGLAPYGHPGALSGEMFTLKEGRVFLNYDWMKQFDRPAQTSHDFKKDFQHYADLAYWAQREIERALLYVVESRYDLHPCENLAYAGGVALNAVANRLIRTRSRFKNLFIQPAAGDNGLALGCAYYGWLQVLEGQRTRHNGSSHFGRRYTPAEIDTALVKSGPQISYSRRPDIIEATADLLAQGQVVAWFQAGSEFGPRALGHRSILSLPAPESVRERINSTIKFREDFRPFAPSVLAEEAGTYFDMQYESPHMILVAPAREEWQQRIAAVVHRDGSCRVQTVHREITPTYYRLLEAIKARTGIPILLNTSLNRRGAPIVETPQEAVAMLLDTALDALAIEEFLVTPHRAARENRQNADLHELFSRICDAAASAADPRRHQIGRMQFVVTGMTQAWTLDFNGPPKASQGDALSADHTVVLTWSAIQQMLTAPQSWNSLYAYGHVQIRGLASNNSAEAGIVRDKVAYLLSLHRNS
jgi:carbamoyltransferase